MEEIFIITTFHACVCTKYSFFIYCNRFLLEIKQTYIIDSAIQTQAYSENLPLTEHSVQNYDQILENSHICDLLYLSLPPN